MARELLGSMGIITHPKIKRFCYDNEDPHDVELKAMMEIKEELNELSPVQLREYRSHFKKNCEQIVGDYVNRRYLHKKGLMTASEFKNYLKQLTSDFFESQSVKRANWSSNIYVTHFINGLLKLFELFGLSRSNWLYFSREGQRVSELFLTGNQAESTYAAAILFTYFYYVYINSAYDDDIFRKNVFSILPDMEVLLSEQSELSKMLIKLAASTIGSTAFLRGVRIVMQKYFNLPDAFFDHFIEESIPNVPNHMNHISHVNNFKNTKNVKNVKNVNKNVKNVRKKSMRKGKKSK